jgi:hypothetical protein
MLNAVGLRDARLSVVASPLIYTPVANVMSNLRM